MNTLPLFNPTPPHPLYVVISRRSAAALLLDLAARLALRGPLLLLDCGNQANPLPLARALRRHTHDPVRALANVQAARAFTCYQAAALIEHSACAPLRQPVLVFDLLASFYDEQVAYAEGRRLLQQCLRCLTRIQRSAPLLVSTRPPPPAFPERQGFVEMLRRISDHAWTDAALPAQPGAAPAPQQLSLF